MTARVKVRPKAQLTLPEEIRRALHIGCQSSDRASVTMNVAIQ
jgi:hypothetical protein